MTELDAAAESLKAARENVVDVLVACSVYIDRRAAEGDSEARELSKLIAGAFDGMRAENLWAASALNERNGDG